QHGTQSRSNDQGIRTAELVKSGKYGKLLISRGLVYKDGGRGPSTRGDIGFRPTKAPPSELDFNIWLGPAQERPYHENLVHYRWHWFWDFGNGDIGNQGVHQMDIARWMIPGATLPKSVVSLGGRIGHKDQGETASSQLAIMDYGPTQLIFEVRGLPSKNYPHAGGSDNVLHFEGGSAKAALNGNADAAEALDRMQEYLAKENNLKLTDWPLTVGKKLTIDVGSESVVGDAAANKLLTREYRAPFAVPAKA